MGGEEAESQKGPSVLWIREKNSELDLISISAGLVLDVEVSFIVVGEGNADDGNSDIYTALLEGDVERI